MNANIMVYFISSAKLALRLMLNCNIIHDCPFQGLIFHLGNFWKKSLERNCTDSFLTGPIKSTRSNLVSCNMNL